MVDKVFPDNLLDVLLDTTFKRHGVVTDKLNLDPNNIEKLRTASSELLGRVDEFLKRSQEESTVEPEKKEQVEQVEVPVEVTPKPAVRRSFWGQL